MTETQAALRQEAQHTHDVTLSSPVRHLLQVDLLIAVEQLRYIVTDDADEEGDEDDGQHHPHANAGVQQELWTGHRSLFNQPTDRNRRRDDLQEKQAAHIQVNIHTNVQTRVILAGGKYFHTTFGPKQDTRIKCFQ